MSFQLDFLTHSVELKGPSYDDTISYDTNKVTRQTRHGDPVPVRDTSWPVLRTRRFTSVCNDRQTIDDLKELLLASAGQEVALTDYDGNIKGGFIITNEHEIITLRDDCQYDVGFLFLESQE